MRQTTLDGFNTDALINSLYSSENGIIKLGNGAIYKFDDWDGTNIMTNTGAICTPVPYKNSLSNVFTGFEVQGWKGTAGYQYISTDTLGLQWLKGRDSAVSNILGSLVLGDKQNWLSESTAGRVTNGNNFHTYKPNGYITSPITTDLNILNESYISWNWHYPCAKAWHANGAASRKVPTPWGIKDSVESNASSGLTGDQVVIELYHPLTGNGCLLYVGNETNRLLDFTGSGVAPEFMIIKNLGSAYGANGGHCQYGGGSSPWNYGMLLSGTSAESEHIAFWNNTAPTDTLISIGTSAGNNGSADLTVAYYFSPLAGLQNFGGYAGNSGVNNQATGCKDGAFFIKKRSGGTGNWNVIDSVRGNSTRLYWNVTNAEDSGATDTGFNTTAGIDIDNAVGDINASGDYYVYGHFGKEMVIQDNIDSYVTDGVPGNGTNDRIQILFEYDGDASGTELQVYGSRVASPAWSLGILQQIGDLSNGRKAMRAIIDASGQSAGDELRWRIVTDEVTYTEHNFYNIKIAGL